MPSSSSSPSSQQPPDLVIRVALARHEGTGLHFTELNPSVWRRFRACSAVNLDLLADKILSPIMGWERNYHTYLFRKLPGTDSFSAADDADNTSNGDDDEEDAYKDLPPLQYDDIRPDVIYLQDDTSATDLMHASADHLDGKRTEKPESATIGDLLRQVGQRCLYTYDLGDSWYHVLTLESIVDAADQRTGSVELLDGAMRCPDEDGGGCADYQSSVLDRVLQVRSDPYDDHSIRELNKACFEGKRNAMNVMASFKPEEFDLEARRRALREVLASRNSARNSVKQFGGMFGGGMLLGGADKILCMARIGQQATVTRVEQERGMVHQTVMLTFKETVNVKPDPKDGTLCYHCGAPAGRTDEDTGVIDLSIPLKGCGRCHCPKYCSRACQADHWATHKKQCKADKRAFERYQQEVETGTADPNRFDIPTKDRRLTRYDPQNLRFEPNTCVECMVGENQWQVGYIVQTLYQQDESWPISAYQIFLPDMENKVDCPLIHAPYDDDYQVRRVDHKDRYKSDHARKKLMGRVRYEWAPTLARTRTPGGRGFEDRYNIWPNKTAERRVKKLLNIDQDEEGEGGERQRAGQRRSRPTGSSSDSSYKHSVKYDIVD